MAAVHHSTADAEMGASGVKTSLEEAHDTYLDKDNCKDHNKKQTNNKNWLARKGSE